MYVTGEQMKKIKEQLYRTWHEQHESLGLVRRTKTLRTYQLDSHVYGTIELYVSTKGQIGFVEFLPSVGIWHAKLDVLYRDLQVPGTRGRWSPHVDIRLSDITANPAALHPLWTDDVEGGINKVLERIARSVEADAIPWWKTNQDLRQLARTVSNPEHFGQTHELPILYLLLDQREPAEEIMRRYEDYDSEYLAFCDSIRARFAQGEE